MAVPPDQLAGFFGTTLDSSNYLRQLEALRQQMGGTSAVDQQLKKLSQENEGLRRELVALQADIAGLAEADARRHAAQSVAADLERQTARNVIDLFAAFHTAMRDFAAVMMSYQATQSLMTQAPAQSLYRQLDLISATVTNLQLAQSRKAP